MFSKYMQLCMDLPIMILSLYVVVAGLAVKHSLLLS